MKYTLLTILSAATLAACSSVASPSRTDVAQTSTSQSTNKVDTLSIRLGQSATADGGRLEVRFDARGTDSRCPANVVCVWQGDAHVQIITRVAGGAAVTSALHSALEPKKVTVDRYSITMVGLTPYPGTGRDNDTPVLIVRVASE
ncbi:MAG TPA: hypothetical protein VIP11_21620 [Gemmatimonadaceae bacterium]